MKSISIIVPTLNEAENVLPLVKRIDASMKKGQITYEIIFVDDHSIDGTDVQISNILSEYPIHFHEKVGERGKAFSLLEGFKLAKYDVLCMIDADLQYPPEAIAPMYELLEEKNVDVILTQRKEHKTSLLRQITTKGFNFICTRALFGFSYDTQSGEKVFRKSVIDRLTLNPTPWSFDLEFVVKALQNNFKVLSYEIPFNSRAAGEAKARVIKVTFELLRASFALRLRTSLNSSKKVKKNYRRSMEIARRVNLVTLLLGVSVLLSITSTSHKADALSLNDVLNGTRSVLSPLTDNGSRPTNVNNSTTPKTPSNNNQTTTPTTNQPAQTNSQPQQNTSTPQQSPSSSQNSTQGQTTTQQPAANNGEDDASFPNTKSADKASSTGLYKNLGSASRHAQLTDILIKSGAILLVGSIILYALVTLRKHLTKKQKGLHAK